MGMQTSRQEGLEGFCNGEAEASWSDHLTGAPLKAALACPQYIVQHSPGITGRVLLSSASFMGVAPAKHASKRRGLQPTAASKKVRVFLKSRLMSITCSGVGMLGFAG